MDSLAPYSIAGKKVFFVQPNSVIQREMVAELIRLEYEVYLISDAKDAKDVFHQYPDCLAFLNIDDGLTEEGWLQLVQDVQSDPSLSAVRLGILTYNPDPQLANRYLLTHRVPCGFVRLSLRLSESTAIITKVLEANEARGRRKFLRVECDEYARLNFKTPTDTIEGRVVDLSTVGLSCVLDPDKVWPHRTVFKGMQLKLKGSLCLVDGVVMGSRRLEGGMGTLYIVLFDAKTSNHHREKIRIYMQWVLQSSVDNFLRGRRRKVAAH